MSDGSLDRNDLVEGENKVPYEIPEFSVVALSVITLGGTPGEGDAGKDEGADIVQGGSSDDEYDEDPMGDPWGSRGGGG
ncbi:MAG: hypothetical protein EA424_05535 [Planctomycetaceae bacterium]|nr:MAG: hypothetical protein EA424_05535 [Planctomycetaceae bacterium]